ncbi:unnamed protein product [Fusarium venenatum]|uniref:Uncharacterized protein n=1 Tax=Fusarium venenatum TaxID=56646 RepID=A0A2L2SQQ2_9HYPO|nr:uncharacterized protein FVRRES_13125 [Fusarium venenatum]CEI40464.1 unnamed protein product [Fusarium venenatum]
MDQAYWHIAVCDVLIMTGLSKLCPDRSTSHPQSKAETYASLTQPVHTPLITSKIGQQVVDAGSVPKSSAVINVNGANYCVRFIKTRHSVECKL